MSEQQVPPANDPQDSDDDGSRSVAAVESPQGELPADGPADMGSADHSESASRASGGSRGPSIVGVLALVVALLATVVAGSLWWQYREFYVTLSQADERAETALERIRASLRETGDRIASLQAQGENQRRDLQALEARLDSMPGRFVDLERRLNALQGVSFDARRRWLMAEAQYYLSVANTELNLAGRWENAIAALELADESLRSLADPSLSRVRQLIAEELLALRAVRLPDIEGLSYSLGRLADSILVLPMRSAVPNRASGGARPDLDEAQPGFSRLWLTIKQALGSIITVERQEADVPTMLTAEERALARRQIVLDLQAARLAALQGEQEAFYASLRSASGHLEREFDRDAAPVQSALQLLNGMLDIEIAPPRPDISRSLSLLRSLPASVDGGQ